MNHLLRKNAHNLTHKYTDLHTRVLYCLKLLVVFPKLILKYSHDSLILRLNVNNSLQNVLDSLLSMKHPHKIKLKKTLL